MESIFASESRLHGANFEMLTFEHVDAALIREVSEPCREMVRTVLMRELVGRLAG